MVAIKLAVLSLASSALAFPVLHSKWKRVLDISVNLARNLESLELALWNQGLNFTDDQFNSSGFAGFRPYVELFRDQEIAHFTILQSLIGDNFTNCSYPFPISSVSDLVQLGQVVTSVGEGAFIGALGNLTSGDLRQSAGTILGNEARQNSKLREAGGLDFFNGGGLGTYGWGSFDTPLSASQAYSLAYPFLMSCPASNPPINFRVIPALNATLNGTAPYMEGDAITLTWNSTQAYLGPDVHINFLIGTPPYSIQVPLNQTATNTSTAGVGMGMTTLPAGVNHTAFLVATNYQGIGAIPDEQNFAIGALVVS